MSELTALGLFFILAAWFIGRDIRRCRYSLEQIEKRIEWFYQRAWDETQRRDGRG